MSYVRAGKKAARTRARRRRRNPKVRPVYYSKGRGSRKTYKRSPHARIRKINPRRRRRNPVRFKKMTRKYFGKARMTNAIMLLVGIGGSGVLKGITANFMPVGAAKDWYQRLYGLISIVVGATLNMQGKKKELKAAGTGMVVFGLYDVIVSNVPGLGAYLPAIAAPTAFVSGDYRNYGKDTYNTMGASLSPGSIEVVGANISANEMPEIIGMDDYDLTDALDMAA